MDTLNIKVNALASNESFLRSTIGAYCARQNPALDVISDIKTAVSEAVTNCIVHGYPDKTGEIIMEGEIFGGTLHINIIDEGVGIENVENALEPFFTTKEKEERSGMGFTIMKTFMDDVKVISEKGKGTKVYMVKKIKDDG